MSEESNPVAALLAGADAATLAALRAALVGNSAPPAAMGNLITRSFDEVFADAEAFAAELPPIVIGDEVLPWKATRSKVKETTEFDRKTGKPVIRATGGNVNIRCEGVKVIHPVLGECRVNCNITVSGSGKLA